MLVRRRYGLESGDILLSNPAVTLTNALSSFRFDASLKSLQEVLPPNHQSVFCPSQSVMRPDTLAFCTYPSSTFQHTVPLNVAQRTYHPAAQTFL